MAIEKLTAEQKLLIQNWFKGERNSRIGCSWCGERTFGIGEYLAATPLMSPAGGLYLGQQYPFVVMICENCANGLFFSAMKIPGLIPKDKEQPEQGERQVSNVP